MDTFSYDILSLMKSGYLTAGGVDDFEARDAGPSVSARQFYVRRLEDNLIHSMDARHIEEYRCGSGSELDDKMRALRSSSAMTFNLLGNGPVNVLWNDSRESYEVSYEVQLPTRTSGLPANLDAVPDDLVLDEELDHGRAQHHQHAGPQQPVARRRR